MHHQLLSSIPGRERQRITEQTASALALAPGCWKLENPAESAPQFVSLGIARSIWPGELPISATVAPLGARAFEILEVLARSRGALVTRGTAR